MPTVLQRARTTSLNVSVPGVAGGEARRDTRGERLEAEDMYGLGESRESTVWHAVEVVRRGG